MTPRVPELEKRLERLKPSDHLCLIYESPEEWRTAIIPFLTIGLKRGEKCIYIVGTRTASQIRDYLTKAGIDMARAEKSGQFVILHKTDAFTEEGFFDPEKMIARLIAESEKAIVEGYVGLRVTEEITVKPRGYLGTERLLEYEAKLNRDFFPRYPCAAICQYDRWKSDPAIVKNAIMTHPLIVRNNQVYQNFYYVSPEEFLTQKREEREVQDWLSSVEQEGEAQKRVRFLSDVLERSSQPFTVSYADGYIMFCNPAFSALTGYTEEELHTMTWAIHLTPPEWRESEAKVLEDLRRTGKPQRYEKECIRRDGSQIPVEVFLHQISDARGGVQYYYTFITDITERKKAEKMLWRSERRFRSLFEDSPISLWEEDFSDAKRYIDTLRDSGVRDFRTFFEKHPEIVAECAAKVKIIDVNNVSLELFGAGTKEELLVGLNRIFIGDSYDAFRNELNTVVEGKYTCQTEIVAQTLAGEKRILSMKWSVAPGHEKTFSRLLVSIIDITERRQAEELLTKSEANLRAIFDNTLQIFILADRDGRIQAFNRTLSEWSRTLGVKQVNEGDLMSEFIPECDLHRFREHFEKALNGEIVRVQSKMHGIWFEFNYAPVWEGNEVAGVCLSCLNIDERKRAVMALARSEERFRSLVRYSSDLITVVEADGLIRYQSPSIERILGYESEDVTGKNVFEFVHPEDAPALQSILADASKQPGIMVAPEFRIRHADGSWIYLEAIGNNLLDDPNIKGVVLNSRDISERKKAEETLKLLSHSVGSSIDGIATASVQGKITYVNEALARMFGYRREVLVGKEIGFIYSDSQTSKLKDALKATMRGDWTGELVGKKKSGELFPVAISASAVVDDRGKLIATMASHKDISEAKRIERALAREDRIVRERAGLLTDLRNLEQLDGILTRVCEAVRDSGLFERAVMTLHEPGRKVVHLGQVGLAPDVVESARKAPSMNDELTARATEKKFRISDSFFIPVEAGVNFSQSGRRIPEKKRKSIGDDWQPGDELFVPLYGFSEEIIGYLSADTPTDGRRPDVKTVKLLEMLVEAGAFRIREVETQGVLKQERDFSQSIIRTANNLIICLDADARITVFNEECERVTGYTYEEVIGKRWPEMFLPPDHRHFKLKSFAKWVREHPFDRYEGPIITKRGEIRTILWSNSAILGFKKGGVVAIAIGQDITERKKAEEKIKELLTETTINRDLLKTVINSTPDWVFVKDRDFRYILVNESYASAMGKSPEDFMGKDDIEIGFPKELIFGNPDKEIIGFRNDDKKVLNGETIHNPYDPASSADGVLHVFDTYKVPLKSRDGNIYAVLGFAHDITERKKAEEALKESEKKFRELADFLPQTIYEMDLEGNLTFANRHGLEVFGYSHEDVDKGLRAFQLFVPEEEDRVRENMTRIASGKESDGNEYMALNRNGREFPVAVYSIAIMHGGKPVGLRGIVVDMTERKETEERLLKLNRCFLSLGRDARKNIETIVRAAGEILGGACMLYNRLEKERGILSTWAIWHRPKGYNPEDDPEGHICYDVIREGKVGPVIIENLEGTKYEKTDPNVRKYKLKSYLGYPVWLKDEAVGSFCLCDVKKREFTEEEVNIVGMLAKAVAIEEDRRRTEMMLKGSEETFREIFENVNDYMIYLSTSGKILDVNKKALEAIGKSKDEVIGKTFRKLGIFSVKELPKVAGAFMRSLKGGPITYTTRIKDKNGQETCLNCSASFIRKSGKTVGVMIIARDVTERKRMEEEIVEAKEYIEKVFGSVTDSIFVTDMERNFVTCNRATEKIFGYKKREIVGKSAEMFYPGKRAFEKMVRTVLKEIKDHGHSEGEVVLRRKDGSSFPAYASASLLTGSDRKPIGIVGVVRDITERKAVEDMLKDNEERLRSVVENASDAIVSIDDHGKIILWNRSAETLYGYSSDEIIGKFLTLTLPERFREAHREGIERLVSTGKPRLMEKTVEIIGLRKDGSEFPAEMTLSSWKAKGRVFFTAIIRRIAEHKRVKDTLKT